MRLHSINIDRFLSFDTFRWEGLEPSLNVLVGPNASGKTNMIHAVRAIRDAARMEWSRGGPSRADQHHRGADDDTVEIAIDLEFSQDAEREALRTFIAAGFCDQASMQECMSRVASRNIDPEALREFSTLVSQCFHEGDLSWLFRGRLVARFNGQYWACWYMAREEAQPWYYVAINQTPWGASVLRGANAQGSPSLFVCWRDSLSDADRAELDDFLTNPLHEKTSCPLPDPQAFPSYASASGTSIEVRRPLQGKLPTHRAFERSTGVNLDTIDRYDICSIFRFLLDRAFVFTDNVRRAPERLFLPEQINSLRVDLSDGTHLGLALFHLKNGREEEQERYERAKELFTAITGRNFDVRMIRPDPAVPAAGNNEGRTRIDLVIRSEWGDIPLEFSGAGIAEALFLSAVIAGGGGQVILLDEPASTMHPTMQTALLCSPLQHPHESWLWSRGRRGEAVGAAITRAASPNSPTGAGRHG